MLTSIECQKRTFSIRDMSENECRDVKFYVSTRVLDNAYLNFVDVYLLPLFLPRIQWSMITVALRNY
jgi:hypothetical protein